MRKIGFAFGNTKELIGVLLTIVLGLPAYVQFGNLGFPDGHLTEYERLLQSFLYPLFFIGTLFFGLAFLWSLFKQGKTVRLWWSYLIFLLVWLVLTYYFSTVLEHGGGG
jgi:ABC-type Na+ efflux pump permease subunit